MDKKTIEVVKDAWERLNGAPIEMDTRIIKILEHFGDESQKLKACEEAGEYIRAIAKGTDRANILEEMAGTIVTMYQMQYLNNITHDELWKEIEKQINRTINLYNIK